MEERKREQIVVLIKKELSKIVFNELEFSPGELLTFTRGVITDDGSRLIFFFTVYPAGRESIILKQLQDRRGDLQHLLIKRLGIKYVPEVQFEIDKGEKSRARLEELYEKIEKVEE